MRSCYDLARPGGNVAVDVSVSFSAYTGIGVIQSRQISCAVIASHAGMPPAKIREHKFDVGIRRTAMQEPYRLSDNESCGGGANKGHRDGRGW